MHALNQFSTLIICRAPAAPVISPTLLLSLVGKMAEKLFRNGSEYWKQLF